MSEICRDEALTVHGTQGTPAFWPPELFDGRHKCSGEAHDLWSLGVTVYMMLFGRLPFTASAL